jgi:hypothetical protein
MTTAFLKDVLKQQPTNIKAYARGTSLTQRSRVGHALVSHSLDDQTWEVARSTSANIMPIRPSFAAAGSGHCCSCAKDITADRPPPSPLAHSLRRPDHSLLLKCAQKDSVRVCLFLSYERHRHPHTDTRIEKSPRPTLSAFHTHSCTPIGSAPLLILALAQSLQTRAKSLVNSDAPPRQLLLRSTQLTTSLLTSSRTPATVAARTEWFLDGLEDKIANEKSVQETQRILTADDS